MTAPDYAAVLADLKERRAQLDAAIAAIEVIIGGPSVPSGSSEPLRPDSFFNMTAIEAATKYLAMKKAPQTPTEIAEALETGGFTHSSKNLANTLYTALQRSYEGSGEVIKVGRKWGLVEWYPGRPRKKVREALEHASGGATYVPSIEDPDDEDANARSVEDALASAPEQPSAQSPNGAQG